MNSNITIMSIYENSEFACTIENWLVEYQNTHGKNINRAKVKSSPHMGVYAFCENDLIGGLTFACHNDWIFLHCGFVLPKYRGQGIYTVIINFIQKFGIEAGMSGIFTGTYEFEAPAFYERMGFTRGSVLHDCPKGNTSIDFYKSFTTEKRL